MIHDSSKRSKSRSHDHRPPVDTSVESRMLGNGHVRFGGRRRGNQPAKAEHGASPSTLYIPFDPQAANLMFMLVSRRYERASMIVTSNKPFSSWATK